MGLLDDIKAKADANGDGKLSMEDLNSLKDQLPTDQLEELQQIADQNGDGKIDLSDLKDFDLQGTVVDGLKDKLGSLGDMLGGKK